MKRDMDLAREILLQIEDFPDTEARHVNIDGRSINEIMYHLELMHDHELIEVEVVKKLGGEDWRAKRLTWDGHEFLDAARSETVWKKAKDTVIAATGTLTMDGLKMALPAVIKAMIAAAT